MWPTPTDRELRRYRWRGESFDTAGRHPRRNRLCRRRAAGPLRTLRVEFPRARGGGHGRCTRTDIPDARADAAEEKRVAALLQAAGHRGAGRAPLPHAFIWRAPPGADRARAGQQAQTTADGRSRERAGCAQSRAPDAWLAGTAGSQLPWVFATHRARGRAGFDDPSAGAASRGGSGAAAPCAPARARELLRQETRASSWRAARARRARSRQRRRVLVSLRNANVHVDEAQILHGIDLEVPPANAGWCTGRTARASHPAAHDLWRSCGGGGRQHHAPGIVPGVPLEKFKLRTAYVAPHLQTWHATENAGDRGGCLGPLRQHRAQ